jgi:PBP1b-binding outer membrane lipoprotein LpoB
VRLPLVKNALIVATIGLSAVILGACASTHSSAPRQVDARRPTVTYQYRNDDELIQANQRAIGFCEPYQSLPKAQHFSEDSEHGRVVVFECVSTLLPEPMHQSNADLRFEYRTDQELLDVSRNAQIHCRHSGRLESSSSITVNSDGTRTVTFHCSDR